MLSRRIAHRFVFDVPASAYTDGISIDGAGDFCRMVSLIRPGCEPILGPTGTLGGSPYVEHSTEHGVVFVIGLLVEWIGAEPSGELYRVRIEPSVFRVGSAESLDSVERACPFVRE